MKIFLGTKMEDVDGKDIIPGNGRPMTLKDVIFNSILTPVEREEEKKKYEKYEVYKKIKEAGLGDVDLSIEEISLIKKSIGDVQPPLILGQAWDLLEGKVKTE